MFDAEEAVEVGVPRAALSAVGAVAVGDVDGRAALGERLQPVPGGGRELFARGDQIEQGVLGEAVALAGEAYGEVGQLGGDVGLPEDFEGAGAIAVLGEGEGAFEVRGYDEDSLGVLTGAVGDIDVGESGAGGGEFAQVGFGGAVGCREAEVATRTAAMPPCV